MSDESDESDGADDLHRAQTTNIPASARGVTPPPYFTRGDPAEDPGRVSPSRYPLPRHPGDRVPIETSSQEDLKELSPQGPPDACDAVSYSW